MNRDSLLQVYQERVLKADQEIEVNKSLSFRYSMVRLGIFILSIPLLYFIIKTNIYVFVISFILITIIFLWAVVKQLKYDKLLKAALAFKTINENEINAINLHENIYYNGHDYQIHNHAYCEDLDLFGAHSLYGLINRSRTFFGNQFLKKFFLEKQNKETILQRQEAIVEMESEIDWRQELAVQLYDLDDLHHYNVAEVINEQLSIDMSFADKTVLKAYRIGLPFIWLGIILLYFMNSSLANTVFAVVFIGNLFLVGHYTKRISEIQNNLSKTSGSLKKYISALKTIFKATWSSKLLKEKKAEFEDSNSEMPVKSLADLSALIEKLDYRLNFLVAIVANGFLLWDLWIVSRLSKWKANNTNKIAQVFEYLGFMECLSSLASWSFNHPEYSLPEITEDYLSIEARNIEHPLIPDSQNVANDFTLNKKDKVSIITGSNMSGKSTFLRTLAINMILGYTGTKTASSSLTIPIVSIVTYMRIKDALEENVSTFKAELNRISMILEVLKTDERAFIFIDEMLRGTNSKDKLNGSIGITQKLLESGTYAIIATHDIKLAELGQKDDRIANYFFDIDYADGDLIFDYKIKPGICENFNASFLLGKLGIDTDTKTY